jgi:hypothetical protein
MKVAAKVANMEIRSTVFAMAMILGLLGVFIAPYECGNPAPKAADGCGG